MVERAFYLPLSWFKDKSLCWTNNIPKVPFKIIEMEITATVMKETIKSPLMMKTATTGPSAGAVRITKLAVHDDVIKWKHFPRYWPFVRGIHRSTVNPPQKGQWCRALMFYLICAWRNVWVNNRGAGDLRCHHARCDVTTVMLFEVSVTILISKYIFVSKWHNSNDDDACITHRKV